MADTSMQEFDQAFRALTGNPPFPWQRKLYERFISGPDSIPTRCDIPTGLGKTSVIAIWLLAREVCPSLPRRLVYVVNRRTVVDQTTSEVEHYKAYRPELAISTLRGQFADNREWSADPSRTAVICGTVDMIGSRLLFNGYGVGFKSKPLHAGFLGQDALLVHDEAHLEPAFQKLIENIKCEQERCREFAKFRVMELTATTRSNDGQDATAAFTIQQEDRTHPIVKQRIEAAKHLQLHQAKDDARIAEEIADLVLERRWMKDEKGESIKDETGNFKDANIAVLIFVRTLDDVKKACDKLTNKKDGVSADHVQQLTGTMRGLERDRMADPSQPNASSVFARFLKPPKPDVPESKQWKTEPMLGTVYLVCTSAGEVGIDISADHMVCDLSTFDSMAQRFGRVNRYGDRTDTRIDVVHPASFGKIDKKTGEFKADEIDKRRQKTLELLNTLPAIGDNQHDASPLALGKLDPDERLAAFAPEPTILPATDVLHDAWALTSIREAMPGRPPIEPYLHGLAEWQPPETHIAWREEVERIADDLLAKHRPADLLDDYPLKPHELLRDATDRRNTGVFAQLTCIAARCPDADVWIVDAQGGVTPKKLKDVVDGDSRRLYGATVLLPPSVGGLSSGGMLDGDAAFEDQIQYDVADLNLPNDKRIRIWSDDDDYEVKTTGMRRVHPPIEFASEDDDDEPRRWEWFESFSLEGGRTASKPVTWKTHVGDVVKYVKLIVAVLSLPSEIAAAIILAAELHDHGKRRERFQTTLGNRRYPEVLLAKTGRRGARLPEPFRHEFASLLDAQADDRFNALSEEMKDLVLHLIAAHHGRARPHFPIDEAFDPDRSQSDADALAMETPRRFARLQHKYGRWGLAYLESLLRAADWAASAAPSKVLDANGNEVTP